MPQPTSTPAFRAARFWPTNRTNPPLSGRDVRPSNARDPRGRSTWEPTAQNWRYPPKRTFWRNGRTQMLSATSNTLHRRPTGTRARDCRSLRGPLIATLERRGGTGRRSLRPREPAAPLCHECGYVRSDSAETIRDLAKSLQQLSACSAAPTSYARKRACAGRHASQLRASSRRPRASRGHQLGYSAGPFSTSRRTSAPSPPRSRLRGFRSGCPSP